MAETVKGQDTERLIEVLEKVLDDLDALNLIQTAARVATAIDTLRAEATPVCDSGGLGAKSIELIRSGERD